MRFHGKCGSAPFAPEMVSAITQSNQASVDIRTAAGKKSAERTAMTGMTAGSWTDVKGFS